MAEQGEPEGQGSDIDAVAAGAALPDQGSGLAGALGRAERAAAKPTRHTGTRVKVRGSEYGKVLVDARGRTLYLLDSETDRAQRVLRRLRPGLAAAADQGRSQGPR